MLPHAINLEYITQIIQESTVPAIHLPLLMASLTVGTLFMSHFNFTDEKYVDSGKPLIWATASALGRPFFCMSSSTTFEVLASNQTEKYDVTNMKQ